MLIKIKNKIETELRDFIRDLDKSYSLGKMSPLMLNSIKEFVFRKGKRLRPILFITGYLGFSKKTPLFLYRSALSLELLHDFMLVHDDIIDKSDLRRGKPSMHTMLNGHLKKYPFLKFNGQDLAIVIGDIMYAMGIKAFLSVQENLKNKEKALKKIMEAAVYTGSGEFIELLFGLKPIEKITKKDIYNIYDYKTAYYTFASPLCAGALLAGGAESHTNKLFQYGVCLGRAFQIKDDILGIFGKEEKIGKSVLTDLQEAKKTVLIWYAYNKSNSTYKSTIKKILAKKRITKNDLRQMQRIIISSGALDYAKKEVSFLLASAHALIKPLPIRKKYKNFLLQYSNQILSL